MEDITLTDWYRSYLLSNEWKAIREKAFKKYGKLCSNCASRENLNVHHIRYNNLGREKIEDLKILCRDCHFKLHNQIKKKNKPRKNNKNDCTFVSDDYFDMLRKYTESKNKNAAILSMWFAEQMNYNNGCICSNPKEIEILLNKWQLENEIKQKEMGLKIKKEVQILSIRTINKILNSMIENNFILVDEVNKNIKIYAVNPNYAYKNSRWSESYYNCIENNNKEKSKNIRNSILSNYIHNNDLIETIF
jgi:hypothetical protein